MKLKKVYLILFCELIALEFREKSERASRDSDLSWKLRSRLAIHRRGISIVTVKTDLNNGYLVEISRFVPIM